MTKDKSLRIALDALGPTPPDCCGCQAEWQIAIDAIKEALAQPEQEPMEYWNAVEGWVKVDEVRQHFDSVGCGTIYKTAGEGREPLYTSPQRTWVGLTKDEAAECWSTSAVKTWSAIEAKLKEKNT